MTQQVFSDYSQRAKTSLLSVTNASGELTMKWMFSFSRLVFGTINDHIQSSSS